MQQRVFQVSEPMTSHAVGYGPCRFDYTSPHEAGGQLVRCIAGEAQLYGATGQWDIPADHMVYIPAGRMFRLMARQPASVIVVKFCNGEVPWHHDGCWVGPVASFASKMIDYGLRWGATTSLDDPVAASYFITLGHMLPGWFDHERIMWTPHTEGDAVQKVIDLAVGAGVVLSLAEAANHVGMSERTLRRHMKSELGQSWREFSKESRMNRAMTLLRKERKSVTETAFEVGFSSSSAFTHAFRSYVGKTPSMYSKAFDHEAS